MKKKKILGTILIALVILLTLLIVFKVFYKKDMKEKVKSFDEQVLIRIENLYEYLNLYYFISNENMEFIEENNIKYYKINKYNTLNDIDTLLSDTFNINYIDKYRNFLYDDTNLLEINEELYIMSNNHCNIKKENIINYKTISDGKSKKEIQVNDIDITLELSNNKWLINNYDYECVGE